MNISFSRKKNHPSYTQEETNTISTLCTTADLAKDRLDLAVTNHALCVGAMLSSDTLFANTLAAVAKPEVQVGLATITASLSTNTPSVEDNFTNACTSLNQAYTSYQEAVAKLNAYVTQLPSIASQDDVSHTNQAARDQIVGPYKTWLSGVNTRTILQADILLKQAHYAASLGASPAEAGALMTTATTYSPRENTTYRVAIHSDAAGAPYLMNKFSYNGSGVPETPRTQEQAVEIVNNLRTSGALVESVNWCTTKIEDQNAKTFVVKRPTNQPSNALGR